MKKDSIEYKLATSVWVLSCTDLPPQMTFKSLSERIKGSKSELIKEVVVKFPELFQEEIPISQFQEWWLFRSDHASVFGQTVPL